MKKLIAIFSFILLAGNILSAREVKISVGAGPNWKEKGNAQFAVWLEDSEGNYLKTLYVTKKASKKSWIFSPAKGRPESLPVWYHSSKHECAKNVKSKKEPSLDAVTSATPKGGVIFNSLLEENKSYIIKAEFNTSFDYNDFYTKKSSGVNGQPSVVYQAEIPADFTEGSEEIRLTFAGTGSLDGSDGIIHPDSSKLTTALSIVKLVALVPDMLSK